MFLKSNNDVKWRFLLKSLIIVIALSMLGIFLLDKPLFLFFRSFDSVISRWIHVVFATKNWLMVFGALSLGVFIKNVLKSKFKPLNKQTWFKIKVFVKEFIVNSKTNPFILTFYSIFFAAAITGALKFIIGRARPVFFEALGQTGFLPFSSQWAFNSMPSGHTSASFAGLVMMGLLFPKYKWATWTIAIVIGLSRIAMGVHFPSDVILGAFIGMVTADLIKHLFFKKIK